MNTSACHLFGIFTQQEWIGDQEYTNVNAKQWKSLSEKEVFTYLCDPSDIQLLKEVIGRSMYKNTEGSGPTDRDARYLQLNHHRGIFNLPLELQLMVLDFVPDIFDVCSAVTAFRWHLPDAYGRRRFPCDLAHELDGIPPEKIDRGGSIHLIRTASLAAAVGP